MKKNNIKNKTEKTDIFDVINNNLVDGKLDAGGALQQIFNEECSSG